MSTLDYLRADFASSDETMVSCIQVFRNDDNGFIVELESGPVWCGDLIAVAELIDLNA